VKLIALTLAPLAIGLRILHRCGYIRGVPDTTGRTERMDYEAEVQRTEGGAKGRVWGVGVPEVVVHAQRLGFGAWEATHAETDGQAIDLPSCFVLAGEAVLALEAACSEVIA
jgi:hypothetical protein